MERRKIKEIELGNKEVFDLKCKYEDERKFFIICDSYGVSSVSEYPFTQQLVNKGFALDELSVGMMSYAGQGVNVMPQLQNKVNNMSEDIKKQITDIICTLGLNDTWDNYEPFNLQTQIQNFITYCYMVFPNLNIIHLAPCGNQMAIDETAEKQSTIMKTVCHVIRQATQHYDNVVYVGNAPIAMNAPVFFKDDGTHPNEVGSNMLFENFKTYIKTGEFPINTFSYIIDEPSFGYKATVEYEGSNCYGKMEWISDINQFAINGIDNFDLIFNGDINLPIMKNITLNMGIIAKSTQTGFVRCLHGLAGIRPIKGQNTATMLLSGHGNTGGNEPEYYNNIRLYASFSTTI